MKRKGSCCTSFVRALSLLAAGLLVAGSGSAWAQSNPSTCTKTGPALLLTELRDLSPVDGVGDTPIVGAKIDGETIYYQATLFVSTATGQCAYEGGTLCINTPAASGCVDVTPVGGIPLLCDNDAACSPDGVAAVDSRQISYVVNHLDFDTSGLCSQQVRAVAEYHNGTSHFGQGVFPVNADTPICNPVLFCGDGIPGNTTGETCDPPGAPAGPNNNVCRANCTVCGDAIVSDGEQCDDGNTNNTDGCTNACLIPFCGDSIVGNTPGETCDPPGTPAGVHNVPCRNDCTVCGDGVVNDGEQCDDGNTNNTDGCTNVCELPKCGDGILGNTQGETCEPPGSPAGANGNICRGDCKVCGDGIVDAGEACDDGNTNNTDQCANDCTVTARCGDGIIGNTPGETCDPPGTPAGSHNNPCRQDCTVCGDGVVNDGEVCDDGNANNNDSCRNTCIPPVCGDGIVDAGEQCDDGNTNNADACQNDCTLPLPCSVIITKTVAPDDGSGGGTACDGVADGPFAENATVDQTSCVVYQICVENTGGQVLDTNGVTVNDPVLGSVSVDFGTIEPGQTVCKQAPGAATAPNCTGGNPAGTSCVCTEVEGVNTATITSAICDVTNDNACAQPGSDCSDTANVACLGPGSCRMTGGHNFDIVDAEFDENGKVYTTGGQIGAPNETGCCELPPKGKCVKGTCTGGLNGGNACSSNDQCPSDPGRNSHCPWGDWEHNHHSGSDDSGSVTGGSFAFHSGTAAAPNEAFIKSVLCADPGWCVQARPAPFKQIFWEGTGVFHNVKSAKGKSVPLAIFGACGANQPKPYDKKTGGTIHYYKAHVSDFGEPAGIHQKPIGGCLKDESCANREPNGSVEIGSCALGDVCLIDAVNDPVKTDLHPLCLAQACSECPDEYEIEIHCTADPSSPIAYRVSHEIREGNFQLHPPVGDSCNPSCGDGVCEPGATGTAETSVTCPADCQ